MGHHASMIFLAKAQHHSERRWQRRQDAHGLRSSFSDWGLVIWNASRAIVRCADGLASKSVAAELPASRTKRAARSAGLLDQCLPPLAGERDPARC
jgi:hypothetical protein